MQIHTDKTAVQVCAYDEIAEEKDTMTKPKKRFAVLVILLLAAAVFSMNVFASGDVSGAIENTWQTAQAQIRSVVDNVVFPVIDMILAIMFFVKLGTAYFDYRKHGQFEFTGPAILFACLIFTLTAPLYIWDII